MKSKTSASDAFMGLPEEEKERQLRKFDEPFFFEKGQPLTTPQRKLWEKAKARGRGRPRVGKGVKVISLSVEKGVLAKIDAAAKSQGVSRSELLTRAWRGAAGGGQKKTA